MNYCLSFIPFYRIQSLGDKSVKRDENNNVDDDDVGNGDGDGDGDDTVSQSIRVRNYYCKCYGKITSGKIKTKFDLYYHLGFWVCVCNDGVASNPYMQYVLIHTTTDNKHIYVLCPLMRTYALRLQSNEIKSKETI